MGFWHYEYEVTATTKEDLLTSIRYLVYADYPDDPMDRDIENDESMSVTIKANKGKQVATVLLYDCSLMDLPNLFDYHEGFYEQGKDIVTFIKSRPFSFSFDMYNSYGDYAHRGSFKFDGRRHITYEDSGRVECVEPIYSSAKAEFVNEEFVNEELDFNTPEAPESF